MRHHLKFLKQPNLIQFLLLFPIIGLYDLKDDIKRNTVEEFTTAWVLYILLTAFWCLVVGTAIYVICTRPTVLLIPGTIIAGITFLLIGIPRIIYKIANKKLHK